MEIAALIPIIIGAVILFFAVRILGRTLKLAVQVLLIAIIAMAFLTFLVYNDVNQLKNDFKDNNSTFFLYENESLYSGVILRPLGTLILTLDGFDFFTPEEMEELKDHFQEKDYNEMMGSGKRLFFFTPKAINKSLEVDLGIELDQDDMLGIIKSKQPFKELASKVSPEDEMAAEIMIETMKEVYGDEEKLKGQLFAAMVGNYFQKQKPKELITNIKSKDIMVYPESISFKMIRYLPWIG